MNTTLRQVLARRGHQDLTAASKLRLDLSSPLDPLWGPVVIRIATAGDRRALEQLAELDSATTPIGATLIGELRGRPVAALSLVDGKAIADPFVATSDIQELLRLRACHLTDRLARDRRIESSPGWSAGGRSFALRDRRCQASAWMPESISKASSARCTDAPRFPFVCA
jgi:hypothetical protein